MSLPTSQASSQALSPEVREILNEIAFQKVLLNSLNDRVENREEAEREISAEIKTLEKQLRHLKRGTTSTASHSTSSASQFFNPATPSNSTTTKSAAMEHNHSRPPGNPPQGNDFVRGLGSFSSTSSTPNSTMDPLPDLTSPISLRNRKRTHSNHLNSAFADCSESKSRRTSPSPYMMGAAMTPGSSSGDDDFPALGDEDFLNQIQKKQEDQMEQERLDEEFARALQDENSFASIMTESPSRPPPSRGPSAFDMMVGRQFKKPTSGSSAGFSVDSRYNPAPRTTKSTNSEVPFNATSPTYSVASSRASDQFHAPTSTTYDKPNVPQSDYSDFDYASYREKQKAKVKNELGNSKSKAEPGPSRQMPGALKSGHDSDSDIEIIDAIHFNDNGHYRPSSSIKNSFGTPPRTTSKRPGFTPESQIAGDAALRRRKHGTFNDALHLATFGNMQQPEWLNHPGSAGSIPLMNSSGNVYTEPYGAGNYMSPGRGMQPPRQTPFMNPNAASVYGSGNAGYNGIETMPGSFPGGNMQVPGYHLGYTVNDIPSYEGYNSSQHPPGLQGSLGPGQLADIMRRNGTHNLEGMTDYLGRPLDAAMQGQVDYIMNDPRKTQEEIKALLENIRPDLDLPAESRAGTPTGLKYPLYEHQKIALTWLKAMEEGNNKGGILADDMGLGKTISTLALILSNPPEDRERKTTLIVGPVALVRQWEREIRTKCTPSNRFSVHMVHGSNKKLSWDELRLYDIVLTTYGTLGAELRRLEKYQQQQRENGMLLDREFDIAPMRKLFPLLGPKSLWYRVILDEAQCIKNKSTMAARASCNLKSVNRFCLTGTPMMNNVSELQSLIMFLRIRPYNDATAFKQAFGTLTKGDARESTVQRAMQKLQAVLKAIMLRRVKGSLIDGQPIITLPPKTEEIQHVVFDTEEQAFYDALETKTRIKFNKYMKAGTVGKNYSNVLVLLLRLRQCCCHPHLITDFEEAPAAGVDLTLDAMKELAISLESDVINRLIEANGMFDCPICYDATTNPTIIIPCGHETCSECLTQVAESQRQQNVANGEEGGAIKCHTCRGTVDMKKIIDYSTFKKVHMNEAGADEEETAVENSDSDDDDDDSGTESDDETASESDVDLNGNLRDFIVPDISMDETEDEDEDEGDNDPIEDDDSDILPKKESQPKIKKTAEKRRQKGRKGKRKVKKETVTIVELKKAATNSKKGRAKYMRYLKKHWQPSAKVTKCVELLERFQTEKRKTIIFSQFVSLLDLLQVPIDEKGWRCERYDGSMNADQRNDAIMRFTDKPTHNIMLISLKAGNAGLNLVAASRVIILDPFWNPYIEMQAIDRAYRIGQQNSIEVHRILIEKTVEDRIIELQEKKKTLINAALDEGAGKTVSRLGERELAFLFGVGA